MCVQPGGMQKVDTRAESTGTEQEQMVYCHFVFPWPQDSEMPDDLKWGLDYSSQQDNQAGSVEKYV